MNELNFRAYITSTVSRDTQEEKEVGFYVENVAVYSDGSIGFSRDDLIDALNPLDITQAQQDEIIQDIEDNSYFNEYDWFSIEFGIVEQFTGLYDRFHNPIYQGDWLRTPDNTYCYVVRDKGFWAVKSLPSEAIDFEHSEFYEKCKVVATYNEHPNYMEEKADV